MVTYILSNNQELSFGDVDFGCSRRCMQLVNDLDAANRLAVLRRGGRRRDSRWSIRSATLRASAGRI
jgi:hypothetical protein